MPGPRGRSLLRLRAAAYIPGVPQTIAVQVPADDADELEKLLAELDQEQDLVGSRPFDGQVLVTALVIISGGAFGVLRTWIRARADARKEYRVVVDGMEMTGYSGAEVERILNSLRDTGPELPAGSSSDDED